MFYYKYVMSSCQFSSNDFRYKILQKLSHWKSKGQLGWHPDRATVQYLGTRELLNAAKL